MSTAPSASPLALLLAVCLGAGSASAQAVGPETFASFTLRHTEQLAPTVADEIVEEDPGQTGTTEVTIGPEDFILAQYGEHRLSVLAQVGTTLAGAPAFLASGNHDFRLGGVGEDQLWQQASSEITARATLVDRLALENVEPPPSDENCARVVAYFAVKGADETDIDIDPPETLLHDLRTTVRFRVESLLATRTFEQTLVAGQGELAEDITGKRLVVDGRVAAEVLVCGGTLDVKMEFELEPSTSLVNTDSEMPSLRAVGAHRAAFEQTAELIGVVVYDADDEIVPDAQIVSQAGYVYPVLGSVPPEPEPEWTILSPVAALGTDLGTYNAEVPLERTIDQSGIDKPFTSGETDWDTYFVTEPPPFGQALYTNGWQSEIAAMLPLQGTIDYDFGGDYRIDELVFWNRSLRDVRALFASDPGGPWQEAASATLTSQLAASFSYLPERLPLDEEVEARYLRLAVDSVYEVDPQPPPIVYAILGEIAARATPVTIGLPEPGAGAGAAAALLSLIGLRRRIR